MTWCQIIVRFLLAEKEIKAQRFPAPCLIQKCCFGFRNAKLNTIMFAEFSSVYYFLKYCNKNGSLVWSKTSQKLAFLCYLNDENLDLEHMLSQLNEFADVFNLKENLETWKKTFNLETFFCDEAFQSWSVELWLCKKSCICSLWISFFLSLFSLLKPSLWKKRNLNKLTEDLWVSKTCWLFINFICKQAIGYLNIFFMSKFNA